jgi:tetratricopeptide (TPR) repeat protein
METTLKNELGKISALGKAGNYAEAIQRLDELAAANPNEPKIWAERAWVNARQGKPEAAIEDWSEAIALREEPHYFYMRGIDWFGMGRYKEAVSDFTKVIELCDFYKSDYYREPAYFFRADAYLRLKEFMKAQRDCSHVSDGMRTWADKIRCKADILAECANKC